MREHLLIITISTVFNFCCYSQAAFENGYFINKDDQKIDCVIENLDWKDNPTEFKYKLVGSVERKKADIYGVKEFGIHNISKYIRAKVNIDRSSAALGGMTSDKNPVFREEQLFLKVIIEGNASLFLYEDGNLTRFFFQTENSEIKQLVFKQYLTEENSIASNNFFRQQLYLDLNCQNITIGDVEDIKYTLSRLKRIFVKYNVCSNSAYVDFDNTKNKDLFNLTIRPGLNISSLSINNPDATSRDIDFGTSFRFRFGVEAEFILPFHNNKWAVIVEPTYQSFWSSKRTEASNVSGGTLVSTVDYRSLELPLGVRHYFFLKNDSKIFMNAAPVFDFSFNSSIQFTRSDGSVINSLEMQSRFNMAVGVGYKHNDRYGVEIRYLTNREVLGNYLSWNSSYKTLSLVVGYSF